MNKVSQKQLESSHQNAKFEESTNALVETKNALTEINDLRKRFTIPFVDENKLLSEFNKLEKLKKRSKEQDDRKQKLAVELAMLHGLENGILLYGVTNDTNSSQGLAKIRQDFINEYQCKTPSELMLVDRITAAYWRGMRYEMYLNWLIEKEPGKFSFDDLKIRILKELHKGVDLANRQFETGLTLLKNLKQPRLNVKVTADNAYVAQNQQVINKGESLKPNDLGEIYEASN